MSKPVTKLIHKLGSFSMVLALAIAAHPGQQTATTQQDVVSQARGAYYSLARKGFKGFTAAVEPDWQVILAQTATPANLKIFRDVRFSVVIDANGAVTVTHEVGPNASSPSLQPTVNRIHADVQRLVTSFFNTWRRFVVSAPVPDTETQIKIENLGKEYLASYRTQSGDVAIAMTTDFAVREWSLSARGVKQTLKPQFQKTADGFLLTDYKHIFEPVGDVINVYIDYQDVNEMKIPRKVRISGSYGSEPVEAELVFIIKA